MKSEHENDGRPFLPRFFWVALAIFLFSVFIHVIALFHPAFADLLQPTVAHGVRATLAVLTAPLPFSLAELFVALLPLWIALSLIFVTRFVRRGGNGTRFLCFLLSFPLLIYTLFVFTIGLGYAGAPLSQKLSLNARNPNAQELYDAAVLLSERAEEARSSLSLKDENGQTKMPFDYAEMNVELLRAYERFSKEHDFLSHFPVGTKEIVLSEPLAYTHITGIYSFFTGEANVNTALSDYATVFTAAHEMAHARGIAREDEANFIAFLVLEGSEHPYLRYAGYMNMLQYVSNALYSADFSLFKEAYAFYSPALRAEFLAYNEQYSRYENSFAAEIAEGFNNAYLESVGTEGTVSYSMVTRLTVAYLLD